MCMNSVQDRIYISWFLKNVDRKVTLFWPTFGGVQCSCDTLTWLSSLSNQYPWGFTWPPEASSRFIRICVHWPFLKYGWHSPETCDVLYLQTAIIRQEPNQASQSTMSPNIHERRDITWQDFATCRIGSTWAIMVWLQLMNLNGHWWTSQLMI
jgi:hypothetical protein